MSDTQRDREERQHVIEVLKSWDGYFIGYTSDEVQEALRYAIASIETDLRYDLLYEETSGQADKQADKPTTPNDCETCIHNKGVLECDMYGCKYEPTTKNDVPDINVGKIEPTPKNNLGVDAVRRKAVLNTLDNMDSALDEDDRTVETYKELLKECYKVLPSVTPIRPKGHWIVEKGGSYLGKRNGCCSNCKDFYSNDWNVMNYCPNCGADMRGEEE